MVVAVVGRVVSQLDLDAGPGGGGVAAAEGHRVHQVLAVNVAADSTGRGTGQRSEVRVLFMCTHISRYIYLCLTQSY